MNRLKSTPLGILLFTLVITLSSCEAIEGIFKVGMWTGIFIVVAIVAIILYFVSKARK